MTHNRKEIIKQFQLNAENLINLRFEERGTEKSSIPNHFMWSHIKCIDKLDNKRV